MFWHTLWKDNGSPRNGILADVHRETRVKCHYMIIYIETRVKCHYMIKWVSQVKYMIKWVP